MKDHSRPAKYDRRGLAITALGGMLFTLDVPLLRLAAGDQWTMVFARGICMGLAITAWWFLYRRLKGSREPFINGWPGVIVAGTNTLANIMFIAACFHFGSIRCSARSLRGFFCARCSPASSGCE
jgi:hypothetical protein